jgi:hypothetical protein
VNVAVTKKKRFDEDSVCAFKIRYLGFILNLCLQPLHDPLFTLNCERSRKRINIIFFMHFHIDTSIIFFFIEIDKKKFRYYLILNALEKKTFFLKQQKNKMA